jgi:hypothetical protein
MLNSTVFFGKGATSTAPTAYTLQGTGGAGTDIVGGVLQLAGGRGTGAGAGGDIIFQTAAAGVSGTTLQALSERMRITSTGLVGIGTSSPQAQLHVSSTGFSATGVRITINSGGTSASSNPFLIEDNAGNHLFRVNATGTVFTSSNYNCALAANCYVSNNPADLAELTAVVGQASQYEPGDLVRQSKTDAQKVEHTFGSYDSGVYGIVTDRGQFLGKPGNLTEGVDAVKVSLVGYVKVKVSASNGQIQPGDYLAAGPRPGIAMKATQPSRVIGIAREAFSNSGDTTGLIEILVQPTFWMGEGSAIATVDTGATQATGDITIDHSLLPPGTADFFLAYVAAPLKALGIQIGQGIVRVAHLVANVIDTKVLNTETVNSQSGTIHILSTDQIQIQDRGTGEIYCTWLDHGEWVKVKGVCDAVPSSVSPAESPSVSSSPTPSQHATSPSATSSASASPDPSQISTPSPTYSATPTSIIVSVSPTPSPTPEDTLVPTP